MACELLAWTAMLALTGTARRWEPKKLRLRLFSAAGRIVRGGRRLKLRLSARWPWTTQITAAISRLQSLAPADQPNQTLRPGRNTPRARGTPPTRRDSPAAAHDRSLKTSGRPQHQATNPRSRKIEASPLCRKLAYR
jgi:Transposase DDE domain group 1